MSASAQALVPEIVAMARLASLRARGVMAHSRPWDGWLLTSETRPWLVVLPEELSLEIVFDVGAPYHDALPALRRLLADRWALRIRVHPGDVPDATYALSDLPLRVEPWHDI